MSRWSKRTDEEKAAILRKEQEVRTQAQEKASERDGGGVLNLVGDKANEMANEVYKAKEIPMQSK